MGKSNLKRLGDYIKEVDERNSQLIYGEDDVLGISTSKCFIQTRGNLIGVNFDNYKVVREGEFAYNVNTARMGDRVAIALRKGSPCIVSSIYPVFETKDGLLPDYLMLWFQRNEFDRYARFMSHGSAREVFEWEDMCESPINIPSIEEQLKVVNQYNAIQNRIKNNKQTIDKLEDTVQAIYRKMFIDEIDPENLPEGWRKGTLGDVTEYHNDKIETNLLSLETYISTENMLKDLKGVTIAETIPLGKCTSFKKGMILLSNIRPYFKKMWASTFDGGCSNDVCVFNPKDGFPIEFVYQTMANEAFFNYVTAGSNGVKMPRGDKNWTIQYPIVIPAESALRKFQTSIEQIKTFCNNLRKQADILSNYFPKL